MAQGWVRSDASGTLYGIGGLLKHARAILAIAAPTTNSYRRLVPGYEAPVVVAYSARNRSAACRIPMYSSSPSSFQHTRSPVRYIRSPGRNGQSTKTSAVFSGRFQ